VSSVTIVTRVELVGHSVRSQGRWNVLESGIERPKARNQK